MRVKNKRLRRVKEMVKKGARAFAVASVLLSGACGGSSPDVRDSSAGGRDGAADVVEEREDSVLSAPLLTEGCITIRRHEWCLEKDQEAQIERRESEDMIEWRCTHEELGILVWLSELNKWETVWRFQVNTGQPDWEIKLLSARRDIAEIGVRFTIMPYPPRLLRARMQVCDKLFPPPDYRRSRDGRIIFLRFARISYEKSSGEFKSALFVNELEEMSR